MIRVAIYNTYESGQYELLAKFLAQLKREQIISINTAAANYCHKVTVIWEEK